MVDTWCYVFVQTGRTLQHKEEALIYVNLKKSLGGWEIPGKNAYCDDVI